MQVKYFSLHNVVDDLPELSLCLGYFDGIHIGHKKLIDRSLQSKYKSALLTFDFADNISLKNKHVLLTINDKEKLLEDLGLDYLLILSFDDDLKQLSPEDFINEIIIKLNAKEVVVGEDYTFGNKALGNINTLYQYKKDFDTIVIPELKIENKKVGTRDIIKYIEQGLITQANYLLGRYYQITGRVTKGYKFGNTHHFPTANIHLGNYVKPLNGVYATIVKIGHNSYPSMCNVGIHPTINRLDDPVIEVNIFDFNDDLYDKEITIQFIDFVREEIKFDNIEELYKQLEKDKKKVLDIILNK